MSVTFRKSKAYDNKRKHQKTEFSEEEDDTTTIDSEATSAGDNKNSALRRGTESNRICDEGQVVLLNSILSPQGDRTYASLLDHKTCWFGETGTPLRYSVHSRRSYLKGLQKKNPARFLDICDKYGVKTEETILLGKKEVVDKKEAQEQAPVAAPTRAIQIQQVQKKMSHSIVAHHGGGRSVSSTECYNIKFDGNSAENPYGIMVVVGKEIEMKDQMYDVATIFLPGVCVRDHVDEKITACVTEDKKGIEITMPTLPSFLLSQQKLVRFYARDQCDRSQKVHTSTAIALKNSNEHRFKSIVLNFPFGTTATADHYNYEDDFKLKTRIWMEKDKIAVEGSEIMSVDTCVYWKVVLDGEKKILKEQRSTVKEDVLLEFQRMNL
jgi:hypothetical protein